MNRITQSKNMADRGVRSTTVGTEDRQLGNADRSINYIITASMEEQDRPCGLIEKCLLIFNAVGEDQAIPSAHIQKVLRFDSIREFRKAVANERQAGALILSNSKGLYLPQDGKQGIQELRQYIHTSHARIIALQRGLIPLFDELDRRHKRAR